MNDPRAAALRREFDREFARLPSVRQARLDRLLAIEVAGAKFALPLAGLASVQVPRAVVSLPSPVPELIGLVALRSAVLPVYDLGALLGYTATSTARWIAVLRDKPIALAFEGYEQHLEVDAASAVAPAPADAGRFVHGLVRVADGARPVISIASVLEAIEARCAAPLEE